MSDALLIALLILLYVIHLQILPCWASIISLSEGEGLAAKNAAAFADARAALEAERTAKEAMKNSEGDIDTDKAKAELLQAAAQLRLIRKLKSKVKK